MGGPPGDPAGSGGRGGFAGGPGPQGGHRGGVVGDPVCREEREKSYRGVISKMKVT